MIAHGQLQLCIEALLYLIDQRLHVATSHIHTHIDAARGTVAAYLHRPRLVVHAGHLLQGDEFAVGQVDIEILYVVDALTFFLVQTYHHVEALLALEDDARLGTGESRRDIAVQLLDVEAVAGDAFAVVAHGYLRQSGGTLQCHVLGTVYATDDGRHLLADDIQRVEVFAIHLHCDVFAYTCQQFVEAQGHGLREREIKSWQRVQHFEHTLNEFLLRRGLRPLRLVLLQDDKRVGIVEAHGVGGDVGYADAGTYSLYLVGEVLQQQALHLLFALDGLLQRRAWSQEGLHGDVALVEFRDEFAAHATEDESCHEEEAYGDAEYQSLAAERIDQQRGIPALYALQDALAESLQPRLHTRQQALPVFQGAQHQFAGHGYIGQAEYQRAQHGKGEGVGHRLEHLATHARKE